MDEICGLEQWKHAYSWTEWSDISSDRHQPRAGGMGMVNDRIPEETGDESTDLSTEISGWEQWHYVYSMDEVEVAHIILPHVVI